MCLPFLRIAALLRQHLYQQALPDVRSPECEFVRLVYFLELVTEGMDWECFNAAVALSWPQETNSATMIPRLWCEQLSAFASRSQIAARNLLIDQHILWHPPRLLTLPREYEKIFTVSLFLFNNVSTLLEYSFCKSLQKITVKTI